jgi:MFS family permease
MPDPLQPLQPLQPQSPQPSRASERPQPSRWRRIVGLVGMDVTPLRRYRDYRLLTASGAVSLFGSYITMVAAPLQMKQLTGSYIAVGLIGVAEFVPMIGCGLWGGAIADSHDRRRVVVVTEFAQLIFSAGLMVNALLPNPQVWLIFVMAAGAGAGGALQRPSLDALVPRIVDREHQTAANALIGLQHNGGAILGPALGGVLATVSLPGAYGVDVASFVISLLFLVQVRPVPPAEGAGSVSLAAIWAGVRYAAGRRDLLGTYVVDIVAMSFAMPVALFPFLADQLHAPGALGLLYSAGAVGGVIATLTSGWTARVHRHGLAIVIAAAGWGIGMALAGIAPGLWLVLACLVLAGAADLISGIFRSTVWNQTVPDELRGRLAGIELLSYTSGPTLGNARAAVMAQAGGVRFSIGAGGLLCVAGVAATAVLMPALARYDNRRPAVPAPAA